MQTSGVGFCAGGAAGFVVFGAVLDAGCCFFLPCFPPPLAAALPPTVEVAGFNRCFLECWSSPCDSAKCFPGMWFWRGIQPLRNRYGKGRFVKSQEVLEGEMLVALVTVEFAPFHEHMVALSDHEVDW